MSFPHPLLLTLLSPLAAGFGGPPNDLCANARRVVAGESVAYSTLGASATNVAPGCAIFGGALGPDVWFLYQATADGVLTVDACQASFDSVVAVYEGDDCGTLAESPRGCNDDACGFASRLDVAVRAGTPYLIQIGGVSGFDTGTGMLALSLQAGATLPFDDCSEAGTLACGGSVTLDLSGASIAPGEPSFGCSTGSTVGTLWFRFVATDDTALLSTFDAPNFPLDTVLTVYSEAVPPSFPSPAATTSRPTRTCPGSCSRDSCPGRPTSCRSRPTSAARVARCCCPPC